MTQDNVKQYLDLYTLPKQKSYKKKHCCKTNVVSEDFNNRWQIDLIDFQSQPDAGY